MSKPTQCKQSAVIKDWYFGKDMLYGVLVTHPKLPTSMFVHTSLVVSIDMDSRIVETLNTVYKLHGDGAPELVAPDDVVLTA